MKELTNEKVITTRELAEQLGTSAKVILENAKKCLPNKIIENGKPTFWDKAEVTVLLEFMKINNNRTDLTFTTVVKATSTELTPALKIKKAMELMQEGYEEELAILRAKTAEQEKKLIEQKSKVETYNRIADSKGLKNLQETAAILGMGSNVLFATLRGMNILYRSNGNNIPMRKYLERGYFEVKEEPYTKGGKDFLYSRTFVTTKGLLWLEKITKE